MSTQKTLVVKINCDISELPDGAEELLKLMFRGMFTEALTTKDSNITGIDFEVITRQINEATKPAQPAKPFDTHAWYQRISAEFSESEGPRNGTTAPRRRRRNRRGNNRNNRNNRNES